MFVFSNLAISLDGKISTRDRKLTHLGTPEDRRHMLALRSECDAVLNGAETLRAWRRPLLVPGAAEQPHNVILSSRLQGVSPGWDFFKPPTVRRILIVGHEAPKARLKLFERSCDIIRLRKPSSRHPVARQILSGLSGCGVERLLIEGGGSVMWEFARLNLIEEYHVTVAPRVIGGRESPTLVDGEGFKPKQVLDLKLAQCRVVGDELYLVYRRTGEPR